MQVKGKIRNIFDIESHGGLYVRHQFTITTIEFAPQILKFDTYDEYCKLIDGLKAGDEVLITFKMMGFEGENERGDLVHYNYSVVSEIIKKETSNLKMLEFAHFRTEVNKNQN